MTQAQIEQTAREIINYNLVDLGDLTNERDLHRMLVEMGDRVLSHQWISVEERLPEKNKMVFVRQKTEVGIIYDVDYIDYEGKWFSNFNRASMNSRIPTHWMPIPPLKGGEE